MSDFFDFEADFVDSLRCIPMQVRLKLDTCGVKLKLAHWHQLSDEDRHQLVCLPCSTSQESHFYREWLQTLLKEKTGAPAGELPVDERPPWNNEASIASEVQSKAAEFNVAIAAQQWAELTPLQRFALIKLSRPSHENRNFYPALREFKLIMAETKP